MDLSTFVDAAKHLARNPLGVIALFIVLIYGVAGLVTTSDVLHASPVFRTWHMSAFVAFFTVFPFVVFWGFLHLVKNHHYKLYAPKDFADPEAFERIGTQYRRELIEDEVVNLEVVGVNPEQVGSTKDARELIEANPEIRKRVSSSVDEHLEAEDLALTSLQAEYTVAVKRNVRAPGQREDTHFDGVIVQNPFVHFVEVFFVRNRQKRPSRPLVVATRYKLSKWRDALQAGPFTPPVDLIIYLVSDGIEDPGSLVAEWQREFASLGVPVQLRHSSLADLRKQHGRGAS
jgi:hypothetical protein